jgi:hypothetical protein
MVPVPSLREGCPTSSWKLRASRKVKGEKRMNESIKKLDGANMDIDLSTPKDQIQWRQDKCPWNEAQGTGKHRCAVKNVSICPYFCGVEYLDTVLCCYPNENPLKGPQ